ncbi:MAG: hypothetical protein V1908_01560 [Candidatus Peregrinibacteria bacterium]
METSNNSLSNQQVSRPWQGTMLGVLNIISLILLGITLVFFIIMMVGGGAMFSEMVQGSGLPIASMFGAMGALLLVPLILIFTLGIFITRGIFKGQKWAIIVTMIFTVLALLYSLFDVVIVSIIINGLFLYAEVICLKNPFYNKK